MSYVLLLRHCVRSTKTEIEMCNGNSDKDSPETKVHISDYITAPLPDYGTPPMWCTEQGINIMAETGRYRQRHRCGERNFDRRSRRNRHPPDIHTEARPVDETRRSTVPFRESSGSVLPARKAHSIFAQHQLVEL